ncbi:DinB superfamily protein [Peribacillus simplex]|uniref:DinB superfamily protein n=1 Tax=Peribacillus simplex TaxID=1478 RepID=A0A9X8WK59_9BACI|nr:DinB family protein [Peribacillus simplex]SIR00681.1 DinB superfamily protein [Peribacillus simplex]
MEALIEEYGRGYAMIRKAIEGLAEEELRFKHAPDKWSIHHILIHVTDAEVLSLHRLKKSLGRAGATSAFA